MGKIIKFESILLEKLKDDYSRVHEAVHEAEDRLKTYRPLYKEMSEFLQEDSIYREMREKTKEVLKGVEELIKMEEENMKKDSITKSDLLSKYNGMKRKDG